jgi:hypothetical protein
MKHFYSIALFASMLLGASAMQAGEKVDEHGVIYDVEGTSIYYAKNTNTSNYNGLNNPLYGVWTKLVYDEANHIVYMMYPQTSFHRDTYIKGTYTDNKISFEMPQTLSYLTTGGKTIGHRLVKPADGTPARADDYVIDDSEPITYTIGEDGVITMDGGDEVLFGFSKPPYDEPDAEPELTRFANYETVLTPMPYQMLYAENMPEDYASKYEMWTTDSRVSVKVATYGNKIYLEGLDYNNPEGIFVGDIDGDTVTIPGGQCSGMENNMFKCKYLYSKEDGVYGDVVFTYSAEKGELVSKTANNGLYVGDFTENKGIEQKESLGTITIKRVPEGISHVPVVPERFALYFSYSTYTDKTYFSFDLYDRNVDGYALDGKNIFYRIYDADCKLYTFKPEDYPFLDQDVDEFGYTDLYCTYGREETLGASGLYNNNHHSVYFNGEVANAGVQVIYRDGDEEVVTDTVYAKKITAVDDLAVEAAVLSETYTDLAGRRVLNPSKGIYIKRVAYSDGTVKTSKVAVR